MTRRRKQKPETEAAQDATPDPRTQPPLPPRTFNYIPPACTRCASRRPTGMNYTRVYSTSLVHHVDSVDGRQVVRRTRMRYLKCGFCGNTWNTAEADQGQQEP